MPKSNKKKTTACDAGCQTDSGHQRIFTSRFVSDYVPVKLLGQGCFGLVLEARDKLVDISYAVKRIGLSSCPERKKKVMDEAKNHARLNHQHIVRYYTTWLEAPPPGWQAETDVWLAQKAGASIHDPGWSSTYGEDGDGVQEEGGSSVEIGRAHV